MWTLLFALAAHAGLPDGVQPVLAPVDAPEQFADYMAQKGRSGEALACDAVWPNRVLLCFKVQEGKKLRWVTSRDLARWKLDLPALRAEVSERARAAMMEPERVTVEGTEKHYWSYAAGDGWAASALLHPELVAAKIGAQQLLVAAPVDGVVLAWPAGDAHLDKIMAIGAKEIYDAQGASVTPVVFLWTNGRWTEFAEARPAARPRR